MPFKAKDLIFAFDVKGDFREKAQLRLKDGAMVLEIDLATCGKTNNPHNMLEPDSEFAVQFADKTQLDNLKAALEKILVELKEAVE